MKTLLTKDSILNADDLITEEIDVPEWGGKAIVRTLTGFERDEFEKESLQSNDGSDSKVNMSNFRARLVVKSVVDEQGVRLFADEDAEALGAKNSKALDTIFDVAQRLSGLRKEDIDALTKNSEAIKGADSISD